MKNIVFVSFYTPNYRKHGEKLIASLKEFGLTYDVQEVERVSWRAAVCSKPQFILDMMRKHGSADAIVWLDADSYLAKKPGRFFQLECDVAARFLYWRRKLVVELVLNVLYLKQTSRVTDLVEAWIVGMGEVTKDMRCPEQEVLMKLLPKYKDLEVFDLPASYSHMLTEKHKRAVIMQFQQSRYEREPEKIVAIDEEPALHNWKWVREERRKKELNISFKVLKARLLHEVDEPEERITLLDAARQEFVGSEFKEQIDAMIDDQIANGHSVKGKELHPKKALRGLKKGSRVNTEPKGRRKKGR